MPYEAVLKRCYPWCGLHARSAITERHKRLAEIMEMIHTASLVHDDVLDECNVRRGAHSDSVDKVCCLTAAFMACTP